MRALLDAHAFLWWITDSDDLSQKAKEVITDAQNELFLRAASGWEIAIKAWLGRLEFRGDPEKLIQEHMALNSIRSLPIQMSHSLHVYQLPNLHRDPFDRGHFGGTPLKVHLSSLEKKSHRVIRSRVEARKAGEMVAEIC